MPIRRYETGDRQAVRQICCDTADRGDPLEAFFDDREVFADLVTSYYTDYEPASTWVAEHEGRVVGYLTGCLDAGRYARAMRRRVLPRAVMRACGRGVWRSAKAWRLLSAALRTWRIGGMRRRPGLERYPAHLHLNIQQGVRRQGLGHQLLGRFLEQASAAGVTGIQAHVRSDNPASCQFFLRMGFHELERIPVVFPRQGAYGRRESIIYGKTL